MLAIPHRWLLLAAALLLLLAVPAGARAACGDYLYVGGEHLTSKPPSPTPKPCDGPRCSQHQLPPLTPAPIPPTVIHDDLCCLSDVAAMTSGSRPNWSAAAAADVAVHTPADVFHPP